MSDPRINGPFEVKNWGIAAQQVLTYYDLECAYAANRQSALLREMMKEQNGMYDVSSKRGSEPYGGTSVHIRSSMQQNRGSQALPCAIEGKLLRNSQSYRSVPKAEAPIGALRTVLWHPHILYGTLASVHVRWT